MESNAALQSNVSLFWGHFGTYTAFALIHVCMEIILTLVMLMPRMPSAALRMRLSTASAPLQLYGFDVSQPTRSILLLCEEAGVNYTYNQINVLVAEHKQEPYLSINPNGTVPTIQDELSEGNVFTLFEGAAMLKYGTFASSHRPVPLFQYPQSHRSILIFFVSTCE